MRPPADITNDPVTAYADAVLSGAIVAGPLVRAACARHKADLAEADFPFHFDAAAAAHVIGFFPAILRLPSDDTAGESKPFELDWHQQFIVGSIFGWKETATGHRRFRIAYIEEGKGNGKSPLAAGVGLYMTVGDKEPAAEVYAAATTRDQAGIMFNDAVRMRDASPSLTKRLTQSGVMPVYLLTDRKTDSFFRPVSSEGKGLDGKRVHCAVIDEVHEHPTETVVEKMRAGTKGRRQALIFMITNSGYDRNSVCWQWHDYGARLLEGKMPDAREHDHAFFYICGLDEKDDWRNEAVWPKANPNIDVSITRKYLREQVNEAIAMPSKQGIVRRLNFCEWTEAFAPWISRVKLDAAWADLCLDDYAGRACWAGLDLSMARDLTALGLAFENDPVQVPADDGEMRLARAFDLFVLYWTPADTMKDRALKDRVPYPLWAEQGHIEAVPGSVVDYGWVADRLGQVMHNFRLLGLAFDRYRIAMLEKELADRGVTAPLVEHGQGYQRAANSGLWMPESINQTEDGILENRVRIARNPVSQMCFANVVLESDAQGNRKFAKHKATGRIDGAVASAMAIGGATQGEIAGPSVYDTLAAQGAAPGGADGRVIDRIVGAVPHATPPLSPSR